MVLAKEESWEEVVISGELMPSACGSLELCGLPQRALATRKSPRFVSRLKFGLHISTRKMSGGGCKLEKACWERSRTGRWQRGND